MKTVQNRIIAASALEKLEKARNHRQQKQFDKAIGLYTKAIFLCEQPEYVTELADLYEQIMDISTALNLHKRAEQLRGFQNEKIKKLALLKGYRLLQSGSIRNILIDCEFKEFYDKYQGFHLRLQDLVESDSEISQHLSNCLAFLQTDYRMFALQELEVCIQKRPKKIQLLLLLAFIKWSITKLTEGYKLMWDAHDINAEDPLVQLFIRLVGPKVQALYKETQYFLIDGKLDKCIINIKRGLELHPHSTNLLIVKAYIHRTKEQYEQALCDLELANKTLKDPTIETELLHQIALTYNEMGTFLYNKKKYSEAIALFNEGIPFKTNDWGMRANRGDCFKALNDWNKALEDYLAAYQLSGDNEDINFRLGTLYNSRGINQFNNKQHRQAVIEFSQAIRYCKRFSQFYINRGKCLLELGRLPQAIADFESASKYEPKNQEALRYLSQYKIEEHRKKKPFDDR